MKNSENRIITQPGLLDNEIGHGVLQSSVQQRWALQEYQSHKPRETGYVFILSLLCEMFADCIFVEHWTGTLQV